MKLDLSAKKAELRAQLRLINKQLEAIEVLEVGFSGKSGAISSPPPPAQLGLMDEDSSPEKAKSKPLTLSQSALNHTGADWTPMKKIADLIGADGIKFKGQAVPVALRRWVARGLIEESGDRGNYSFRRKV